MLEVDKKELEKFLNFLQEKVEEIYKEETENAIRSFLSNKEHSNARKI